MIITADGMQYRELREEWTPVKLVEAYEVSYTEWLLATKPACVSFKGTECTKFNGPGSFVVLDFGKELCGGIRMITRDAKGPVKWRLTFGESLTEAYSSIGEKNATNDHSPRDMEVVTGMMSDLCFGQTGFRFVRVELIEGEWAMLQSIFAVSMLPYIEREAQITTNDELLNEIIKTAAYTLKLTFQNGYIWDGIKRDRLVWCGDLNPEIITSLYLFGDNENIKNSLNFLKETTPADEWMNWIPTYSAWWVINLCDYCRHTGNKKYFRENKKYALEVMKHFDRCIKKDGSMNLINTLECVNLLAIRSGEKSISKIIQSLSMILRYAIGRETKVKVKREIQVLESYIEIQRFRFGDRISIELDVDESLFELNMIKFVLQPILENAISHGVAKLTEGGKIEIVLGCYESGLEFRIRDNGVGMSEDKLQKLRDSLSSNTEDTEQRREGGIGLRNVYRRIALYYKGEGDFVVNSAEGQGTEVIVRLPFDIE